MWPRRSETLAIGLSSGEIAWRLTEDPSLTTSRAAYSIESESLAATGLAVPLSRRLSALHVVAGSSVARHWIQTPPPGIRSLAELRGLVQSRAEQLFGSDAGWVVAGDWNATQPFLCATVPRAVDSLATSVAKETGGHADVSTSLTRALDRHAHQLPADGWAALHEPEALHCLYISCGNLVHLRTTVVPAGLRGQELELAMKSEIDRSAALAGGLPTNPVVRLSLGGSPSETQAHTALGLASTRRAHRAT